MTQRKFKWLMVATAAAALMAEGGPALAAPGAPITVTGQGGDISFDFSDSLIGVLYTAQVLISGVGQTRLTEDWDVVSMRLDASIDQASIAYDDATHALSPISVQSGMGVRFHIPGVYPNGKRDYMPRPGKVTFSNMEVDFANRAVYADLEGDNGVGLKPHVRLWDFSDVQSTMMEGTQAGTLTLQSEITGLAITQEAFDLMAKSLALDNTLAIPSFRSINDYGVIRTTLVVDTRVVPEPGAFALMGIGLAGVGLLARARSRGRRQLAPGDGPDAR